MPDRGFTLALQPTGTSLNAPAGTPLRDLLFEQGVEFPCGGNGRCRGCRVRVIEGRAELNDAQRDLLTESEAENGWRLACQCRLEGNLAIELRQWDASILVDDTRFEFTPREGLGAAVDVGTTTLAAQLVDLETGHVLAVKTALNPQARYGADVMSRVQAAVADCRHNEMERDIRREIARLIRLLMNAAEEDDARLVRVVLAGNTVMHHLFCGVDLEPLSHYPFEPVDDGLQTFSEEELGWSLGGQAFISFLPCLGGFVGSDILAGVLATKLHESDGPAALIDLGTNGEIAIGNRQRILVASTAAGPAFEGALISCGMRASSGAIWKVSASDGAFHCDVLGNVEPRGICGSGLVDSVAVGLDKEWIMPTGRLSNGRDSLPLCCDVALTQTDIRQLQLAKGAIAAGILILSRQWGVPRGEIDRVFLAGAFGNYIDLASARKIGLLAFAPDRVQSAGNTALLGAKLALFASDEEELEYSQVRAKIEHVSLNEDPEFQNVFVEEMSFPMRR